MNLLQLTSELKALSKTDNKHAEDIKNGVIQTILNQYINKVGYYEKHAINHFKEFINNNILNLSEVKQ